jgi:transcriptional regulator with XRE-family HTH domain
MSDTSEILAALRAAMVEKGLNSAALANAIGVDRKALRRALGGQLPLSLDSFCKAASVLALEPAALPWGASEASVKEAPLLEQADEAMTVDPYGI